MRSTHVGRWACLATLVCASAAATAESVYVRYRGPVDLAPFACLWTRSSFVKRVCHDAQEQYVIVNLNGTYYHYCEVPERLVREWLASDSLGRFYNAHVKGRFDCRVNRLPGY